MKYKWLLVVYLQIVSIYSAPTNPQPVSYGILPQMPVGLSQMPFGQPQMPVGLSQLAQSPLLRLPMPSPMMYQPPQQPMIIILPNSSPILEDDRYTKLNEHKPKDHQPNTGHIDETKEAVVLEAEPSAMEAQPKNAVVYLPNEGRYVIGTIISYIPFLPIEINVPDTISSIGNWIAGIFSRPSAGNPPAKTKRYSQGTTPVLVMPFPGSFPQL